MRYVYCVLLALILWPITLVVILAYITQPKPRVSYLETRDTVYKSSG